MNSYFVKIAIKNNQINLFVVIYNDLRNDMINAIMISLNDGRSLVYKPLIDRNIESFRPSGMRHVTASVLDIFLLAFYCLF